MATEFKPIDISRVPELVRLAREVKDTREPRVLRWEGEDIAVLVPVKPAFRPRKRTKSAADYEAFLSSAGGWRDLVDTEKLIEDIYESRRISSRPPVAL